MPICTHLYLPIHVILCYLVKITKEFAFIERMLEGILTECVEYHIADVEQKKFIAGER
jgi:hypothetical protein